MSFNNYKEAISIISKNKSNCFFAGPQSEELITLAENTLEIKFPKSYREFLMDYGAGSFGSQEIFGIISEDFENSSVPDGIWYTLTERREIDLPKNLLVIYDTGSGELFCLDSSKLNEELEYPVVSFVPGVDLNQQKYEKIAGDFGEFLLELAENEF